MIENLAVLQTTLGGANLAVLLLVLYRVSHLEENVKDLSEDHSKVAIDVAVLNAARKAENNG